MNLLNYKIGDTEWKVISQWDFKDYSKYKTKFETIRGILIQSVLRKCYYVNGSHSKWEKVKKSSQNLKKQSILSEQDKKDSSIPLQKDFNNLNSNIVPK